jgi:hypothetical protein
VLSSTGDRVCVAVPPFASTAAPSTYTYAYSYANMTTCQLEQDCYDASGNYGACIAVRTSSGSVAYVCVTTMRVTAPGVGDYACGAVGDACVLPDGTLGRVSAFVDVRVCERA